MGAVSDGYQAITSIRPGLIEYNMVRKRQKIENRSIVDKTNPRAGEGGRLGRPFIQQLCFMHINKFNTFLIPFFSGIWFATDCRCYLQYKVATWQVSLLAALSLDGHRINLEGVQLC